MKNDAAFQKYQLIVQFMLAPLASKHRKCRNNASNSLKLVFLTANQVSRDEKHS